jgi:hypothetical protein
MPEEKELIAYCGFYCGDCPGYQRKIADTAFALDQALKEAEFERFVEFMSSQLQALKNYSQFKEVLQALAGIQCPATCRKAEGPPQCEIRNCCLEKGLEGCWLCAKFETCAKFDFLKPAHIDTNLKNLRILKDEGVEVFLSGKRFW